MQYLHIKNLNKYHPGYRDRNLVWAKIYFNVVNGDPEFEMVDEIDKWRFIAFIILELQAKKPIPIETSFLLRKGFNLKKRPILLTIQMLHNFIELVEANKEIPYIEKKYREEEEGKNKIYSVFEKDTLNLWNSFCDKNLSFSKVREISDGRRTKLKKRFEKDSFRNFDAILKAIKEQPFLMGENERKWKVTFDWLIENDTNYLKVLELRYKDKKYSDTKAADPDCQVCAGTGWDETDGSKRICRCRLTR